MPINVLRACLPLGRRLGSRMRLAASGFQFAQDIGDRAVPGTFQKPQQRPTVLDSLIRGPDACRFFQLGNFVQLHQLASPRTVE